MGSPILPPNSDNRNDDRSTLNEASLVEGHWVARRRDGAAVASNPKLSDELDDLVVNAGYDIEEVAFEQFTRNPSEYGGIEIEEIGF